MHTQACVKASNLGNHSGGSAVSPSRGCSFGCSGQARWSELGLGLLQELEEGPWLGLGPGWDLL